jgi:hypothetical protein
MGFWKNKIIIKIWPKKSTLKMQFVFITKKNDRWKSSKWSSNEEALKLSQRSKTNQVGWLNQWTKKMPNEDQNPVKIMEDQSMYICRN